MRLTDPKFPWTWPFFFTSPWSNSHSEEEQTLHELARGNSLAKCCGFINIVSCSPGWASILWRNFLRYHWAQVFSNSTSQNNSSLYFPLIEERPHYWHREPCLWLTDFKHGLFYWSIYGICESVLKAEKWWLPKRSPGPHRPPFTFQWDLRMIITHLKFCLDLNLIREKNTIEKWNF